MLPAALSTQAARVEDYQIPSQTKTGAQRLAAKEISLAGRVSLIRFKVSVYLYPLISSVQPQVYVASPWCGSPGLPARIPESYVSQQIPVSFGPYADAYATDNETTEYDLVVNQPVPFGIVSSPSFVAPRWDPGR